MSVSMAAWSLALCIPTLACSEGHRNLGVVAPTSSLPAVNGPFPNGQEVALGKVFHGTVGPKDPPCTPDPMTDAPNPCRRLWMAIPDSGYVSLGVRFDPPPDTLIMLLYGNFYVRGDTIENAQGRSLPTGMHLNTICNAILVTNKFMNFAIAMHAGSSPVEFDLTSSWAPTADAVSETRCPN